MKFKRDRRVKRWPGELRSRAGESVPVTFDPEFWDREITVNDHRTIFVEQVGAGEMPVMGREESPEDPYFSMRLGVVPPSTDYAALLEGWGPIVHADVYAIYPVTSRRFQIEIKVMEVHEPTGPIDLYAKEPGDGAES